MPVELPVSTTSDAGGNDKWDMLDTSSSSSANSISRLGMFPVSSELQRLGYRIGLSGRDIGRLGSDKFGEIAERTCSIRNAFVAFSDLSDPSARHRFLTLPFDGSGASERLYRTAVHDSAGEDFEAEIESSKSAVTFERFEKHAVPLSKLIDNNLSLVISKISNSIDYKERLIVLLSLVAAPQLSLNKSRSLAPVLERVYPSLTKDLKELLIESARVLAAPLNLGLLATIMAAESDAELLELVAEEIQGIQSGMANE